MKSRDVVGKRIVEIWNERISGDREYYGPRVVCSQITLEDGTRLVAHCYESSDQPIASIDAVKPDTSAGRGDNDRTEDSQASQQKD